MWRHRFSANLLSPRPKTVLNEPQRVPHPDGHHRYSTPPYIHQTTLPEPSNMAKKGSRFTTRAKYRKPYCRESSPVPGFVPRTVPYGIVSAAPDLIKTPKVDSKTRALVNEGELLQAVAQLSLANSQLSLANAELTRSHSLLVAQIIELSRNQSVTVTTCSHAWALSRIPLTSDTCEGSHKYTNLLHQSPGTRDPSDVRSSESQRYSVCEHRCFGQG